MNHAFVNGEMVETQHARVSIEDRGLRYGDGVFETIRLHRGVPYLWTYHMERLNKGLEALHIPAPKWPPKAACKALLLKNKATEGALRISITRGIGSKGYLPTGTESSLIIETMPHIADKKSAHLWLSEYRRISPVMLPTHAKTAQGLNSTLALLEAERNDHDNALLLSIEGHVSECANANIFWTKNDNIFTSPLSTGCTEGVTRRRLMELAPITEKIILYADLLDADAVAISNSRIGLKNVTNIASPAGSFDLHAKFKQLASLLEADVTRHADSFQNEWR